MKEVSTTCKEQIRDGEVEAALAPNVRLPLLVVAGRKNDRAIGWKHHQRGYGIEISGYRRYLL